MADRMALHEQAMLLAEEDRAAMASVLLRSLDPPGYDVSDAEVLERRRELESGEVEEVGHEELLARVKRPSKK